MRLRQSQPFAAAVTLVAAMWLTLSSFTVVIDPGHGGKDYGTIGAKINEKSINLAVAQRLQKLLRDGMPDATVVMTRSNDTFVTLQGRCDIANHAKGDIFVSIHTNSVGNNNKNRSTIQGASVYTLGLKRSDTNLEVAMRENSVMKLEDDYTATYSGFDPTSAESYIMFEMTQSSHMDQSIQLAEAIQEQLVSTAKRVDRGVRQEPFWVLVRTSMPAVLVELDFICNPEVESFLGSDKGRDKLAKAIYNGITAYRKNNDTTTTPVASTTPATVTTTAAEGEITYKIQFLTSTKTLPANDKRFKGLTGVESYTDGDMIKYTVGQYTAEADAEKHLKQVKKQFSDAFIIKTINGKRIK